MARYVRIYQTKLEPQSIHRAVNQYLSSEGYEYINYDGENVYKKGVGIVSPPTFFKFSYVGNTVKMETWMKYTLLPGVHIGEFGIDGFVGFAVKGSWKGIVRNIEGILSNCSSQVSYCRPSDIVQSNKPGYETDKTQILNGGYNSKESSIVNEGNTDRTNINEQMFCRECISQTTTGLNSYPACDQKCSDANALGSNPKSDILYKQQQHSTGDFTQGNANFPTAGRRVGRKEFIDKYAQPSLRKNIIDIAILCYICVATTVVVSCFTNPYGIIDALVLLALTLGMHLAKSRVCAILITIFSVIETVLSLISGSFPFWILIAGIASAITFGKIEKQYKQFLNG